MFWGVSEGGRKSWSWTWELADYGCQVHKRAPPLPCRIVWSLATGGIVQGSSLLPLLARTEGLEMNSDGKDASSWK